MSFNSEEINEFKSEAHDLLDAAEKALLQLDKGDPLSAHYDAIFRAFHSIKGAAGMMGIGPLQAHMHQLETIFTQQKQTEFLTKPYTDFFLKGLDATRSLLDGKSVTFSYEIGSSPQAPLATKSEEQRTNKTAGRILVVDDEEDIVSLLTTILKSENFEVRGLTSAVNIKDEIADFKPDAIFSDISMPEVSGLDLLKLVNEKYPDLPVVFISGFVSKEILLEALRLGIFGVIEKPFDVITVTQCAFNAVERSKLTKMLSSSINLLMYQFSDLREFLTANGKEDVCKVISTGISSLLEQRRIWRYRNRQNGS